MIVVDASMLAHRCYAKMDFLKASDGTSTGMEFGFLRTVESLQRKYPDHDVVVAFDSPTTIRNRQVFHPKYKANRSPKPATFYERFDRLKAVLVCLYDWAEALDLEADQVMHSLSLEQIGALLYSNDNDLLQSVNDERDVRVLKSFKSKTYEWNEAKVREKYGVSPRMLPFLRAYTGDASDNLKGVGRVRRSYLATLLNWAEENELSTEQALAEIESAKGWTPRERALLSDWHAFDWWENYELMKLKDVHVCRRWHQQNDGTVVDALRRWEVTSLKLCERYRDQLASAIEDDEF